MTRWDAIPAELRALPRWVVWRWGEVDPNTGKRRKPPYVASEALDRHASSTNPDTWATFETASALVSAGLADGVGFALCPPYVGVDLDAELSQIDQDAILCCLDSYSERSPSGEGHHVVVKASLNGRGRHPQGIGVFQTDRFFYVTGDHVDGFRRTIEERQRYLDMVIEQYLPRTEPEDDVRHRPVVPVDLDDQELLDKAMAATNGAKFSALWNGVTAGYPSASEAEAAFCCELAFWTGRDPDRIDRLFRASGLYRKKWERADYRERTIAYAIKNTSEVYEGPSQPRPATPSQPRPRVTPSPVPSPSGGDGADDPVPDPGPVPSRSSHSWVPVDLVARRARPPAPPSLIGLFYPGYNHLVSGESESLKTWLVAAAAVDELQAGRGCLWVDGDDVGEGAILERLLALGAEAEAVAARFAYVLPDEPLNEDRRGDVLEVVRARACRLAVLDGFNPLLVLHELDPNAGTDVERFYRLIDPIRKLDVATVLTDNVVKAREARGAWAIGSERKKTKAEVHLGMRTLSPLVRGGTGKAKIEVHKDRPGHLERPSPGVLIVESTSVGLSWWIQPDDSRDQQGGFRPTNLMERVSRYLETVRDPQSPTQIEQNVTGKAKHLRRAIACLIEEGYAIEFDAPVGKLVRLERAFRQDEDEAA